MAYGAHIHGHSRICGATTTVENQNSVYVNGQLWAVKDTTNNHGNGQLIPTGTTVIVENKEVIVNTPDHAQPDDDCPDPPNHCDPYTTQGSGDVLCY